MIPNTEIAIDGTKFLINGRPTYEGREWRGRSVEGLLFNSRMVQAIFDDECPQTRPLWAYPDTGAWDPDRNTREFCAALPDYRAHGLLAVTVGMQGGGAIFRPEVYNHYLNSAFTPEGVIKSAYLDRLERVLAAADRAGMVVIVNYFYWKQVQRIPEDATLCGIAERLTDWLLATSYRNILVDVVNEAHDGWKRPALAPDRVHVLLDIVRSQSLGGRRLPAAVSTCGGEALPVGMWAEMEDFSLPHGNGLTAEQLRAKLRRLKASGPHQRRPRPVCVNEDSIFIDNLEAAAEEGCSWGFYCQGYGSAYKDRMDWTTRGREDTYEALSGYQTPPVNWSINTPDKRAFFDKVREITGGA